MTSISRLNPNRTTDRLTKTLFLVSIILLSIFIGSTQFPLVKADSGITRIQGNARGTSGSAPFIVVNLADFPTANNILVASIGVFSSAIGKVSAITQTGVTWTHVVNATGLGGTQYYNSEIWIGTVQESTSKSINISFTQASVFEAIADIVEYSGVSLVDKTATSFGSNSTTYTGVTATTTDANELWVGAVYARGTQTSPTDNFTGLDGALNTYGSQIFLEKIVSITGTASSHTSQNSTTNWYAGCIATFSSSTAPSTDTLNIWLNSPANTLTVIGTKTQNFTYTPTLLGSDKFYNSSLFIDNINVASNASTLINNTINGISYTFPTDGTYTWCIQVFNSTHAVLPSENYTITIDTDGNYNIALPYQIIYSGTYHITNNYSGAGLQFTDRPVALCVTANNVQINGENHTVTMTTQSGRSGIFAVGTDNVTVENVTVYGAQWGIAVGSNSLIQNCTILGCQEGYNLETRPNSRATNCTAIAVTGLNNAYGYVLSSSTSIDHCAVSNYTTGIASGLASQQQYTPNTPMHNYTVSNCTVYGGRDVSWGFTTFENNNYNFTIDNLVVTQSDFYALVANGASNFTIRNCNLNSTADILKADNATGFVVDNCKMLNGYGTIFENSTSFQIENTVMTNTNTYNLILTNSTQFSLSNVTTVGATYVNIYLQACKNFKMSNCNVYNGSRGIYNIEAISGKSNITITNNNLENMTTIGCYTEFADLVTIANNTFSNIGSQAYQRALEIDESNATVSGNTFRNNFDAFLWGIYDSSKTDNITLTQNNFIGNTNTMYLDYQLPFNSTNSKLYFFNNFVNDTTYFDVACTEYLANITSSTLSFNTTYQAGNRIYGAGDYIGGNYWAHPNGTGYSQTAVDNNHDGFIDSPYQVLTDIYDYLPLSAIYSGNTSINLLAGWNLVSFSVLPSNLSFASILDGVPGAQVKTWNGTANIIPVSADAEHAYWIYTPTNTSLFITGTAVNSTTIHLTEGWTLIGSIYNKIVNASSIFNSYYQLYSWNGTAYQAATSIQDGKGYWAFVLVATDITLQ